MRLQEKLKLFGKQGKALLAANFYNFETLSGVLQAAQANHKPVILQLSESSIHYLGLDIAINMAKSALKTYDVEGWVHLDHGEFQRDDVEVETGARSKGNPTTQT